jgi:hypothetical protein
VFISISYSSVVERRPSDHPDAIVTDYATCGQRLAPV